MKKKFPAKKELCSKVYLDECFAFHADKFMSFLHIFSAFSSFVHTLKLSFRHLPVYLSPVCLSICLYMYFILPLSFLYLSVCISVYRYISLSVCQNVISFFKDQQIRDDISIRKDLTRSGMSSVYFKCVNSTLQASKSQVSMHS